MPLTLLFLISIPEVLDACELSCTQSQQVSFDENCEALITPNLILSDDGASCPDGTTFSVGVRRTMNGPNLLEGPTVVVDEQFLNETIIVEVTADDGNVVNRCWGNVLLEDKLAPSLNCPDITVSCAEDELPQPTLDGNECGDFTINLVGQSPDMTMCSDTLKTFDQSFTATDEQGNTTPEPCTRTVSVIRLDIEEVIFPENFRVSMGTALSCDGDYPRVEEGSIIPDPSFTGVPTLDGEPLFPTDDFNCNTVVTYEDMILPEVGCVTKVMRTFTISEWICGEDQITDSTQIIEIVDNQGPEIQPINDATISTSTGFDCEAAYLLPPVNAEDNCKEVSRIDIAYPGGFIEDYDGFEMITLDRGSNLITVTAYDACLNSTEETFTVLVEDNNAPVAVCDQNTVVALSSNPDGLTEVAAISFDDGSYDECGLASPAFSVKRMDDGAACGIDGDEFSSSVFFCCSDIGNNPQVIFRVTDLEGNTNTCMVNVELQDKLPTLLIAPADMTVECDEPFDLTEQGLIDAFGDATGVDNCGNGAGAINRSFADLRDDCNLGEIRRFFTNPDGSGNTAVQRIFFENDDPFDVETDIEWPDDVTLSDCLPLAMGMQTEDLAEVSPDVTGRPILSKDACDMVGIDYDDMIFEMFNSNSASCFKIIRTFTVGDWCQDKTVRYSQTIMVINEIAPELQLSCDTINVETFDAECEDGEVTLRMAASDDCTPASALSWQFSIDANNDGSFDTISPILKGSEIDSLNGEEVSIIDASGDYPIGTHRIVWTVEDRCGNLTRCTQIFTVSSGKAPTPYCYNGLAIEIMGVDNDGDNVIDDAMIDIWASDFDAGSFHSCGYDVTVSFSPDPLDTGRTYTCSDLGENPIELWATVTLPDGTQVQDFCTSYIDVQDNMDRCSQLNGGDDEEEDMLTVRGRIATESELNIEEVAVQVTNMDMLPAMTNVDGEYLFAEMQQGGSYSMKPHLDKNPMNGVTTIDLVLIQRYILGLKDLESPYKIIASDINNDGQVTAKDLLDLRKSILGLTDGIANNTSWKFVDRSYNFIDPTNPLQEPFAQSYDIYNMNSDMAIDYIGVKIGDVNNTVKANRAIEGEVRSSSRLNFAIEEKAVEKGEMVEIPVYADNFDKVYAFQFTIEINKNLSFVDIKPGALEVNGNNFGLQLAHEGLITTSWDDYVGKSVDSEEPLFYLHVSAENSFDASEAITFGSSITKAEAYSEEGVLDVNLVKRNQPLAVNSFKLFQNTPNPFESSTVIRFELPVSQVASLNIYDVTGKLINSYKKTYQQGMNEVEISVNEMPTQGVLYYTLSTENYTATRKMVVIK